MATARRTVELPPAPTSYALRGLTKRFPGVVAVDGAALDVRCGELHGIIGRNGAGKSVLVSMIAGLIRPTSGTIAIGDATVDAGHYTPARAHELGVALVPQEPRFATKLSVTDNLFMGRTRTRRFGFTDLAAMEAQASEVVRTLNIDARPTSRMGNLPLETQQLLAFGGAVWVERARVILLDEITASLSKARKLELLQLLRRLLSERPELSFTLISHHIAEIMEFCDRVTVMRDGRSVATIDVADTTAGELARWIVGDAMITKPAAGRARPSGPAILEAENVSDGHELAAFDLELRKGEVVGFAGLEGSGKDAAIKSLFGISPLHSGEIRIDGKPARFATPRRALEAGVAYLPRHREEHGIIQNQSVEMNTLLCTYGQLTGRLGLIRRSEARRLAQDSTGRLAVKTPSLDTLIDHLSGGNKQKVLINRLTLASPQIFLLNEPTRGVDISAKPALLAIVRDELAKVGAVVMISESEEELIDTCDRILIFFKGVVTHVLERDAPGFKVGRVYELTQGVQQQ